MLLGVFMTTDDIEVADGKYSFRDIAFPNFSDLDDDERTDILRRSLIPSPLPEEANINHFDPSVYPLLFPAGTALPVDGNMDILPQEFIDRSTRMKFGNWGACWLGELFLAKSKDRAKVVFQQAHIIRYAQVPSIGEEMDWYCTIKKNNQLAWLRLLEPTTNLGRLPGVTVPPRLPELKAGYKKKKASVKRKVVKKKSVKKH
jgi:hypothetical protein